MVETFTQGARMSGYRVEAIHVCQKQITGCLACEYLEAKLEELRQFGVQLK